MMSIVNSTKEDLSSTHRNKMSKNLSTTHTREQININRKVAGGRTGSARYRRCFISKQRSKVAEQTFAMFDLDDKGNLTVSHNEKCAK